MPLLTVDRLTLTLNGMKKINDVSFTLAAGERLALLGASGSGKSLTARTLQGIPTPHGTLSGSVRFAGQDILSSAMQERPPHCRIAAIFQDSSVALYPLMSVGRQIGMALKPFHTQRRAIRDACHRLLATVGFTHPDAIAERYPGELSGGQRQRVCIALALACQSPLLVADEPTTALDVVTQAQVLDALRAYTQGANAPALLFITHDIAVAAALCDRAIILSQGEIIEQGRLCALLRAPRHPYTRGLIASARRTALPQVMSDRPPLSLVG